MKNFLNLELLELSPLIVFFQFIMNFAYYILYLCTYFKETYIILALQVKEGVVPQKGPTAHNSLSHPLVCFSIAVFCHY